ncbi:MAG TPA: hypothetical protein VL262_13705 [Vicinamibacterales bacterium]|nr:hypothetical protein [Vicinamibacterales bacterium]
MLHASAEDAVERLLAVRTRIPEPEPRRPPGLGRSQPAGPLLFLDEGEMGIQFLSQVVVKTAAAGEIP